MFTSLFRLALIIGLLLNLLLQPTALATVYAAPEQLPARSQAVPQPAAAGNPVLALTQTVSQEPLLGGDIGYTLVVANNATTPLTDRGYNLTISDTLPAGLRYNSADPAPSLVALQADGTTQLFWDNIADLEAGESLRLSVVATLGVSQTIGSSFVNRAAAQFNTVPDNSGTWLRQSSQLTAQPQAIDIDVVAQTSTALRQASGAGEYDGTAPGRTPGADWRYQYQVTLRNNRLGSSTNASAKVTLPPGVAYLGSPAISPSGSPTPTLTLREDGALDLIWGLGTLTTARYSEPLVISFAAAVPYRFRTAADLAAGEGPFAGPMSGTVIPDASALLVDYEASATYGSLPSNDGTQSTPADDTPATVTSAYATLSKAASPTVVGIGSSVDWTLRWYVSEYYSATTLVVSDTLPDGMSYITDSATITPSLIQPDFPAIGQTTLNWEVPISATTAGQQGVISFQSSVDEQYAAAPNAGQPVVSGDTLTNQAALNGNWQDILDGARAGALIPSEPAATVTTRMPTFSKQVWNPATNSWTTAAKGFTGDTMRFRLTYNSATDVDARGIVIRDFLPRGMTYVVGSAAHTTGGSFSTGPGCVSAATTPTLGSLNGLQFLEWRLCNAASGSHWQVTIDAVVGDMPNVQPGWLVANFGKLTGQNTHGLVYSLRDSATTDYAAPSLTLTKSANPDRNLVGGSVTSFTIAVTNNGAAPAYNLRLIDTLPPNLLVADSGGSGSPASSSYTTSSGSPSSGAGGVVTWSTIASLAPGATQIFRYQASVPNGLAAGTSMTNLASVAYNSRADGTGHQWPTTTNPADLNTEAETVYLRGLSLTKSAAPAVVTIGETVSWTITGTVPPGEIGYWPVVQENSLPQGFAYLSGTTVISGALLDTANHAQNPLSNGNRELRWFIQTLDNSTGNLPLMFMIKFDTLVTGREPNQPATLHYPNNCCLATATNTAYVGWYDTSGGYNGQGYAYHGLETNKTSRRSPKASANATIRQPSLTLATVADHTLVGASDKVTLTLRLANLGNSDAHDLTLTDTLPVGLTLLQTEAMTISYPPGFPSVTSSMSDLSTAGTTDLRYQLDTLHVGATWIITVSAQVDGAIAAGLSLINRAAASYSSRPGAQPDSNGDGYPDEREYRGPVVTLTLNTPAPTLQKSAQVDGELTFGATVVYTLTVPAAPINATVYGLVITDTVDSRLQVQAVSGASFSGNQVGTSFSPILPGEQRTVVFTALLPHTSSAKDGETISNLADFRYDGHAPQQSNIVALPVVAPALTVDLNVSAMTIIGGDQVVYSATLTNVGGGQATSLQLQTLLPANMTYIAGSARLQNEPLADPDGDAWRLPPLNGHGAYLVSFAAKVADAEADVPYLASASLSGKDSRDQAIPADNQTRVAADSDPDDSATARVYGPLNWQQQSVSVAFEDLKKVGWNDWDYNDFIVRIMISQGRTAKGELAALDIQYDARARGAGFDHDFHHALPILGGGRADLIVQTAKGQTVSGEQRTFGDEPSFTLFRHTRQVLPPNSESHTTNTWPGQTAFVTGYTARLTVVLDDPAQNLAEDLPPVPWDPYISVYDTGQEVHLVMPGHLDNTQKVNTAFDPNTPLRGFDLPLANVFTSTWRWPIEYAGIWHPYPAYIDFVRKGGTVNQNWADTAEAQPNFIWANAPDLASQAVVRSTTDAVESAYFGSPALADLDGDGTLEIALGNLLANRVELYNARRELLPGWPQPTGGGVKASPVLADLDGDGSKEVLAGAEDGKLYAWHRDGRPVRGWPVLVGEARLLATPAIADLDGNGSVDIVVPLANGKLYAFSADGSIRSGWPVSIGDASDQNGSQVINSSPRIVDLDGNGQFKIVVGSTDHKLYVFNADGSLAWFFLTGDMILGSPAIADFVPARPGLEIALASGDSYVYLLSSNGTRLVRKRTGWTIRSTPLAADLNNDTLPEIIVGGDDHKVYAWNASGTAMPGWPQETGAALFAGPTAGDLDGDGQIEIVTGADDGQIYAWHADGSPVAGWPRSAALAIKGTPVVAALTAGQLPQVIVGDLAGMLTTQDVLEHIRLPLLQR